MIGIVTALLKALSLGGVKIGPMVGILAESLLMEAGLLLAHPRFSAHPRLAFILAGALAVSWNFFHKFVMMRLLFGKGVSEVGIKMVKDGSKLLGLDVRYSIAILAVLLLIRLVVGVMAGWLAWDLGGAVRWRLAREIVGGVSDVERKDAG
jgi:hypothetical protein